MIALQLVEESFGTPRLRLQRIKKFEEILVRDRIAGRGRQLAEQMIDRRGRQRVLARFQVTHVVRGVGDCLSVWCTAKANFIDRGFEQRIERGGYEKIELADLGELAQHLRRREGGLLHDAAYPRVKVGRPGRCLGSQW